MQKKLLLLSFVEGAAVMAAELCGAKLLAPVFGSSLYVWASVMGITLAALAGGYFFGGWISEKSNQYSLNLYRILAIASLFLLSMPLLSYYVVPRISYLPFLPGVIFSTFLVLFLPVFFLGATSPLFILLQTKQSLEAGKVSGTVYAVSTVGGIFATFLCGFYLIPTIGLNACLLFFGGVLFIVNFIVFKFFNPAHFFLVISFAYLNFQFIQKKGDYLMGSDSILGRVEVKDIKGFNNKSYRILTVNDIVQTEMDIETKSSLSKYVSLVDTLVPNSIGPKKALLLGLGGGLIANLLESKNYRTDGVELDERIIEAAKKFFFLNENVNTFYEDARYFLNKCEENYSVVMVDVFKGEEQPSHVLTKESLEKIKTNLSDSGLILINWHGYISGKNGTGTAILYNTLIKSGFNVKLCSYSNDENYRNVLFVASLSKLSTLPFELHEQIQETNLINSDKFPLLEKYNAEANKAWRLNYLRYYQSGN
ncbi:fused MFS/spermidine synthase [Aurantibacillus circumpalustris]|uniref:fused MFS/spermidine synthase n=1 Tax=Aurantibacillus circumpalustris TaxID=3036359 RepID=UPI00295AFF89|nr:fused MFS/spermidine synthase [Aurantibacillus circumpalustris]